MELQTHFDYAHETEVTRQEPAPLKGWKLIFSWIVIFSLGWIVALGFFGGLYWLFRSVF